MKMLIALLILAFAPLLSHAADTNTVTVTVTLTPAQAHYLAGTAKTNLPAIKAEAARAFTEAVNRRIATASADDEKAALQQLRGLTAEQKNVALGILSGRKLTPEEKAAVKAIAEKVLAE